MLTPDRIHIPYQVHITVSGAEEGQPEAITTEAMGTLLYKAPYTYVSYEEKLDAESPVPSKTILKFSQEELWVTRKGEVESTLHYQKGLTHSSIYTTAMGNFELMLHTEKLLISGVSQDSPITILVTYTLGINTMPPTPGKLKISICPASLDGSQ